MFSKQSVILLQVHYLHIKHSRYKYIEVCLNTQQFEIRVRCSQIILMNRVEMYHHPWYVAQTKKAGCILTMGFEYLENYLQLNRCNKRSSDLISVSLL